MMEEDLIPEAERDFREHLKMLGLTPDLIERMVKDVYELWAKNEEEN